MTATTDPATGLHLYEPGHPWGYNRPTWPGHETIRIERLTYRARHGVLTQRLVAIMHTGTHLNAPIHLVPGGEGVGELPMDLFFGSGVVVAIPKGATDALTRVPATEWSKRGITVNAIAPTVFRSDLTAWMHGDGELGQATRARSLSRVPIGRLGEVEDLIGMAPYLLSPASDFCTGQVMHVVGGYTAG